MILRDELQWKKLNKTDTWKSLQFCNKKENFLFKTLTATKHNTHGESAIIMAFKSLKCYHHHYLKFKHPFRTTITYWNVVFTRLAFIRDPERFTTLVIAQNLKDKTGHLSQKVLVFYWACKKFPVKRVVFQELAHVL